MIWYQESEPIESVTLPIGYKSIYVPYPNSNHGKDGCFVGMRKNNSNGQSLMDGIKKSGWWWYCVGSVQLHDIGIPGPMIHSSGVCVKHTEFYVFDINLAIHKYAMRLISISGDPYNLGNDIFLIMAEFVYNYRDIINESMYLLHHEEDDYE